MKRNILLSLLLISSMPVICQDTLNQLDINGKKQGYWKKKNKEGICVYEGQFRHDIPYGVFLYFYPDGKLKTKSIYSDNGTIARTISYYPNGRKMAAGKYVFEKKDSIWQFFTEKDGALISQESYVSGEKEGYFITYFPKGGTAELIMWQKGRKNGLWEQYYSDGKIKFRGSFRDDEKEGNFTAWDPSGIVIITGQYGNGHQDGIWCFFNEKGELLKKEIYDKGVLLKVEEVKK